jgi:hypothetical protein
VDKPNKGLFTMNEDFWKYLAYGWLATQSLAVVLIIELIVLGKPLVSLFLVIFFFTLHYNLRKYPDLPLSKKWPFIFTLDN